MCSVFDSTKYSSLFYWLACIVYISGESERSIERDAFSVLSIVALLVTFNLFFVISLVKSTFY